MENEVENGPRICTQDFVVCVVSWSVFMVLFFCFFVCFLNNKMQQEALKFACCV